MSVVAAFVSRNTWPLVGVAGLPTAVFFAFDNGFYGKRMARSTGATAAIAISMFVVFRSLDPKLSNINTLEHVVQTLGSCGAMAVGAIVGISILNS